ncbi:unnamed protein product [Polarella glacialis]|uniref:ABC transmembrane type-1 domain-containing protein n=1 Tax=Polarella glacialis TaxID=89957 RepID=A0A813GPM8_POLGL|nr:unnamed protein product [Polarella glacialis]
MLRLCRGCLVLGALRILVVPALADRGEMGVEVFSAKSASTWTTLLLGITTLFIANFLLKKKPPEILQAEQAKKRKYSELMSMIMKDVEEKQTKAGVELMQMDNLPEAERLFALLWDDVKEVRTTTYGIHATEKALQFIQDLLKVRVAKDLASAIDKTKEALAKTGQEEEEGDEYLDGGKLKEKVDFCDLVRRRLGKDLFDAQRLKEGKEVYKHASKRSMKAGDFVKKARTLFELMTPIFPWLLIAVPCSMVVEGLQSIYYQVARWQTIGEAAAAGEDSMVAWHLVGLAVGHVVIWFFELVRECYSNRAQGIFLHRIRTGVMKALIQQDYEYFDKNSSGSLQERLNRDAEQLWKNVIALPQEMLSAVTCIRGILPCHCTCLRFVVNVRWSISDYD